MSECKVSDCPHSVYVKKRQLCQYHYNRFMQRGHVDSKYIPKPPKKVKPVPKKREKFTHCVSCMRSFKEIRHNSRGLCVTCYNHGLVNPRICKVEECSRPHQARGYCAYHYDQNYRKLFAVRCAALGCETLAYKGGDLCSAHASRLSRHGDLMTEIPIGIYRETRKDRRVDTAGLSMQEIIDKYLIFTDEWDCAFWLGQDINEYGKFYKYGKEHCAHVVSYQLAGGVIPEGYVVDHLCMRKACGNPKHLEAVTQAENLRRAARYYSIWENCIFPECETSGRLRGMCPKHYRETFPSRRFGNRTRGENIIDYVAKRTEKRSDGCHDWVGSIAGGGTPRMSLRRGKNVTVYRYLWELENGEFLDEDTTLDHLCNNSICINTDHLEPVTHEENMRRAWDRKRAYADGVGKVWHTA